MTEKYKIWDTENKQWFVPTYPGFKADKTNKQINVTSTKEIFFSQSGEMYLYEQNNQEKPSVTHIPTFKNDNNEYVSKYIPCVYSGVKDVNGRKLYLGDVVSNSVATWEVIFNKGCFSARFLSKIKPNNDLENNPSAPVELPVHIALRGIVGAEYLGNKFENPDLIL